MEYVLDFTKPIMTMLYFVDTNAPCLGDIHHGMEIMIEKIKVVIQKDREQPQRDLFQIG